MTSSTDPTPPLTESTTPSSTSTHGPTTPAPGSVLSSSSGQGDCTSNHVLYCFEVLVAHFEKREPAPPPFEDDQKMALFVTWNKYPSEEGPAGSSRPALRGCIGNFSPMSLGKGLREYALISALQDHRFKPITQSELPYLSCSVSLLTPTTPISDPLDWIPGTHGIQITFPLPPSSSSSPSPKTKSISKRNSTRKLSATYLPEIATDQNWTREETIKSAIRKAGYSSPVHVGDPVWQSLEVGVYESRKLSLAYRDYERWREGSGSV